MNTKSSRFTIFSRRSGLIAYTLLFLGVGSTTGCDETSGPDVEDRRRQLSSTFILAQFEDSYSDQTHLNLDFQERVDACGDVLFAASSPTSSIEDVADVVGMWEYAENGCTHQTMYLRLNFGSDMSELQALGVNIPAAPPNTTFSAASIFVEAYNDFDCADPADELQWYLAYVERRDNYTPYYSVGTSAPWDNADLDVKLLNCTTMATYPGGGPTAG